MSAPTQAVRPSRVRWDQVMSIVAPWRWPLLGALVCVAGSAALKLAPALVLRRLIDDQITQGRLEGIGTLALLYLGAMAGMYLLGFGTSYLTTIAAQGALRQLRVRLFAHLQQLPISYYDRTPLGDTISRCTSDMDTINTLFSSGMINVLGRALQLGSTLLGMVVLSPYLSSVMVLLLPLLWFITRALQVRIREAERAARRATGRMNAHLQESLVGVEVIRAFHWQDRVIRRFRRVLHETLLVNDRSIGVEAIYSPLMNILAASIVMGLFWLSGSGLLARMAVTIGTLTAFILLFLDFFDPLIEIGDDWQVLQGALAGVERVFEILSLPTDGAGAEQGMAAIADPGKGSPAGDPATAAPLVEVRGLSFGYREGEPVLSGVSLQARAGEHIAIVGRTGAGKSSLFHLLGGLYHPWEGTIRLLGRDPAALASTERRRLIGVVPQVVQLFSGTVRDNLTLGDASIAHQAVEAAARMAGADTFIRALPQGYDTPLSDRGRGSGTQLSAGQRQLLALARALAGDPAILLLDEATAAIDSATEAAFREALQQHLLRRRGVVLTVAHRLSTALQAGYILVMEGGRVVEQGTPEELLGAGGRLATLWELENAGWEWRQGG